MMAPSYKIPESVLVVIYTRESEVLLIRRADAGTWQSVTGSKDALSEPWEETACREVMEETGLDARHPALSLHDWALENVYEIYPAWRYRYAPGVTPSAWRKNLTKLVASSNPRLKPTPAIV